VSLVFTQGLHSAGNLLDYCQRINLPEPCGTVQIADKMFVAPAFWGPLSLIIRSINLKWRPECKTKTTLFRLFPRVGTARRTKT
jgi:hypothetical protein